MNIQEANYYLLNRLLCIYPKEEAANITDWVMEHLTGSKKAERMIYKNSAITAEEESQLLQYTERLLQHEPVQYVLNEAWFYDQKFYVDNNVLIPRPETEELVDWVLKEVRSQKSEVRKILDIGTGSGCIAITLKKHLPSSYEVVACDINQQVLSIARKNAEAANVSVDFIVLDFLNEKQRAQLPPIDFIISNPPYVPKRDKDSMNPNVVNYEPHNALFVPDNDPLIFYNAIADFGKEKLIEGGTIYVELYENLGYPVAELFRSKGYPNTELKKDMQGKNRMLKAES